MNQILPTVPSSAKHKAPKQTTNHVHIIIEVDNTRIENVINKEKFIEKDYKPSNDITPHTAHTVKQRPMLPEYFKAAVGDINIPDPIITPIIILTADKRPIFRFSPTCSCFSSTTALKIGMK